MKPTVARKLHNSKRRIARRLDKTKLGDCSRPMFSARNIRYEIGDRCRGIAHGGLGAIHLLVRQLGLIDAIDERLHLLKIHLPFHESDHVLNFAYNALCDGTCLQDMELRRNDEVFLDALGARRSPDPTTAGDFCRRFGAADVQALQDIFDDVRIRVWAGQPDAFFAQATIDMDGTLVATTGECKRGMDIAYDGTWGYHPLVLSLANTHEVLRIVNRSGNRPSHEGAAAQVDRALAVCFQGGFRRVRLRGDTDFSQTEHLDRWNADGRITFIFGYDSMPNLRAIAEALPERAWRKLERPPRYTVRTEPRRRPDRVKEQVVLARLFDNQRLQSEEVAEFDYRPAACQNSYRMVVVRKNISVEKGEQALFDQIVYFFYLTNDWGPEANEIVFEANDRCDQENLLAQLRGGVRALTAPVDNLVSNWAYMVMTGLAWNLKAWWALTLPEEPGRWQAKYRAEKLWLLRIEFKTFVNAFVRQACQVVRTGRQLVYRLLAWNPQQPIFFRLLSVLRC
ncbi:MAG TPA: IS1380 family transposase [Candidatus Sulfotelmatobacter sp.]|nr:IS1380 family transposase [Candidatus Sulfotelmatobacter sp.]